MYKKLLILFVLIFILLPVAAIAGEWELVGGPTMNSLNFELNAVLEEEVFGEEIDINLEADDFNGLGYYLGGRYWINDKFAVGAGFENISSDIEIMVDVEGEAVGPYSSEIAVSSTSTNRLYGKLLGETTISGFYGEAVYQINEFFALTGGVGKYDYRLDGNAEAELFGSELLDWGEDKLLTGDGYGYNLGFELKYPVYESFDVIAGAAYRKLDFDIDKSMESSIDDATVDMEVDGFTGKLGISYSF